MNWWERHNVCGINKMEYDPIIQFIATFYIVRISRVEKGRRIGMAIGQMDLQARNLQQLRQH